MRIGGGRKGGILWGVSEIFGVGADFPSSSSKFGTVEESAVYTEKRTLLHSILQMNSVFGRTSLRSNFLEFWKRSHF